MLKIATYDTPMSSESRLQIKQLARMRCGWIHVGTSNLCAVRLALTPTRGWRRRFFKLYGRSFRREIIRAILKTHSENRALYVRVMGGL